MVGRVLSAALGQVGSMCGPDRLRYLVRRDSGREEYFWSTLCRWRRRNAARLFAGASSLLNSVEKPALSPVVWA